ncbi:MAG: Hpt domain-containing protein, partial [Lachnospiraceae bacterium]|nr:Hpt domain-containing protein [Lachnospiraceae bacterium]
IALTANAIAGMREKYIQAGFTDYLSKPVKGEKLEEMLIKYLPVEKVRIVQEKTAAPEPAEVKPESTNANMPEPAIEQMDEKTEISDEPDTYESDLISKSEGMSFFGNNEKLYFDLVKMFVEIAGSKKQEIEDAFDDDDWNNYAVGVHALKSSAKNIGAGKLFDLAKRVENACAQMENEKNRALSEKFIHKNHETLMRFYDETVEEAKRMLG